MTANIAILGSGQGSYLKSLVKKLHGLAVEVSLVLSNKSDSGMLAKATELSIPAVYVSHQDISRETFDKKLDEELQEHQIDYVLLVGFMRILGPSFCDRWHGRVINVHPSLLPKYQGLMDLSVHQAVLDNRDKETGCSVHFVTSDVDAGPVIAQERCVVKQDDDALSLKSKVQALEVIALVNAIKTLRVDDDKYV